MADLDTLAIHYFQGLRGYFWKWADKGNVLESANGRTICYREDLIFILEALDIPDPIGLGTIILLLCACQDNYETLFELEAELKHAVHRPPFDANGIKATKPLIPLTLRMMKVVNSIPFECRSGMKRIALCQAVLGGPHQADNQKLQSFLKTFRSGALDEAIFHSEADFDCSVLQADLAPLAAALERLPDAAALETKLRTGIIVVPKHAALTIPTPLPDELMAQLAGDLKTAGLARLAHKISAALNIPMHLSGSSDQSIGGISDISNRGHYDKLLLSELAQDDLLLTARLANNEALFLQREELPNQANQEWHILLDTTLKMWGMPRVFALATALAFSEARKQDGLDAWALGGKRATAIDLKSKAGIIGALEQLDPGLHCAAPLKKQVAETASAKAKFVLITSAQNKQDAAFMSAFAQVKEQLDYLVEVNRDGHIALFETRGKRYKQAASALIDLEETLFDTRRPIQRHYNLLGLPAMLSQHNFPLLFPASKIKLQHGNTYKMSNGQTAIITQDRRVLCWTDKDKGATELIDQLAAGDTFCGEAGGYFAVLIKNLQGAYLKLYQVDIASHELMIHTLNDIHAETIKFDNGLFHVARHSDVISIDPRNAQVIPTAMDRKLFKALPVIPHFHVLNQVKKLINNGYSVINSVKNLYVNPSGRLLIDQRELRLDQHGRTLSFKENELNALQTIKPVKQEMMEVAHLPLIKFTKFTWTDGSEAVLDSRGMLHLKSSDSRIAECTIILVIEKTTACWSADGKLTGSPYFTGNRQADVMLAADFYHAYIEPFIRQLQ